MGPAGIEGVDAGMQMQPTVIKIDEVGGKGTMKLVMKLSQTKQEGVV